MSVIKCFVLHKSPSLIFTYKSLLIVTVQGAFSAPLVVLSSVAVFGMGEPEFFLDTWGAAQAHEKIIIILEGAQFRKKRIEEEEKRVKDKGMHLHSFCMITLSMSSMKG